MGRPQRKAEGKVRSILKLLKVPVSADGYFSLPYFLERIDAVETDGSVPPATAQQLRQWASRHYVAFTGDELPTRSAGRDRDFTPSYDVDEPVHYTARTRAARQLAYDKPELYHAAGLKREAHVQLPAGRVAMRHPAQKSKTASEATRSRLASESRPYRTRTQSEKTLEAVARKRVKHSASTALGQIEAAIRKYRASHELGREGFLVPQSVAELTDVGFPKKEATLLVARAKGRLYMPPSAIERKAGVMPTVQAALGVRLQATGWDVGVTGDGIKKTRFNVPLWDFYTAYPRTRKLFLQSVRPRDGKKWLPTVAKKKWNLAGERNEWESIADFFAWLEPALGRADTLSLTFSDGITADVTVEAPLSGEHSDILPGEGSFDYRKLNVSLSRLPQLLTRMTRRV